MSAGRECRKRVVVCLVVGSCGDEQDSGNYQRDGDFPPQSCVKHLDSQGPIREQGT